MQYQKAQVKWPDATVNVLFFVAYYLSWISSIFSITFVSGLSILDCPFGFLKHLFM